MKRRRRTSVAQRCPRCKAEFPATMSDSALALHWREHHNADRLAATRGRIAAVEALRRWNALEKALDRDALANGEARLFSAEEETRAA